MNSLISSVFLLGYAFFFNFTSFFTIAQTELIPVLDGELWGFCDAQSKQIIVPPQFQKALLFSDGVAIVSKKTNDQELFGLVDAQGKVVVQLQYQDARSVKSVGVLVKKDNKWGLIQHKGGLILPLEYDELSEGGNDKLIMKKGVRVGLIDTKGSVIVPPSYDEMRPYKNGFAAVKRNRNWTFIDQKGNELTAPIYEAVQDFTESGVAVVQQFGKRGLLATNGQQILPCEYDRAESESEGLIGLCKTGKWGFVDKTSKVKIDFIYDNKQYGSFVNGLAPVSVGGKWGYVNPSNQQIIATKYESATNFSKNGTAKVQQNGKYHLIDTKGNILTTQPYSSIAAFSEGFALVQRGGKYGYINQKGEEIIPCEHANAGDFNNGLAPIMDDKKTVIGYIDISGKAFR